MKGDVNSVVSGDVVSIEGALYVFFEPRTGFSVWYKCIADGDDFELQTPLESRETLEADQQGVLSCSIGRMPVAKLEPLYRESIFEQVAQFHALFHSRPTFVPGETALPYSGKVYDHREMVSLTDAALDFWLTSGRYVEAFERDLARVLGVRYVMLTNSGSSANLLALTALTSPRLGERRLVLGDEVLTVAAAFPTTVAPIVQNGLVPVFVDVDLLTCNVDAAQLEAAISPRTRAIMLAHTMGNPFDIRAVMDLAQRFNLWVIEDNCDALGSRYEGKLTGTFGHIATSSFYPPHHITMGEGGAVYTNDPLLKVIVESFRDWGRDCWCDSGCDNTCGKRFSWHLGDLPYGYDHKYTYSHLGYNLKTTDLQAAVGVEQLRKLEEFTSRRKRNFAHLRELLNPLEEKLILPEATKNSDPSWFGFILTLRDGADVSRDRVVHYLQEHKLQTRMLFAGNITKQPAFKGVDYRVAAPLHRTDKIMNDTFLVGVYPGLTDDMVEYMGKLISCAILH